MTDNILVSGGNVKPPRARTLTTLSPSTITPGNHPRLAITGASLSVLVSVILYIHFYITNGHTRSTTTTFTLVQPNFAPALLLYTSMFLLVSLTLVLTSMYCKGTLADTQMRAPRILLPTILLLGVMLMFSTALGSLINPNQTLTAWGDTHNIDSLQLPDHPGAFAVLDQADNKVTFSYTNNPDGYTIKLLKVEK